MDLVGVMENLSGPSVPWYALKVLFAMLLSAIDKSIFGMEKKGRFWQVLRWFQIFYEIFILRFKHFTVEFLSTFLALYAPWYMYNFLENWPGS